MPLLLLAAVAGLIYLFLAARAEAEAARKMNAETGGAGYALTTYFTDEGVCEERVGNPQARLIPYAALRSAEKRGSVLILHGTGSDWTVAFWDSLTPEARRGLVALLRARAPQADLSGRLEEKRAGRRRT